MHTMDEHDSKSIIGRLEKVSFPEFGIYNIDAKIDTGADFGCIHAKIVGVSERGTAPHIQFIVLDSIYPEYRDRLCEAHHFQVNSVKNSYGIKQNRYVIITPIVIAGKEFPVKIGLSDRSSMKYPVLIGRKMLEGKFLVDVSGEFLASKNN